MRPGREAEDGGRAKSSVFCLGLGQGDLKSGFGSGCGATEQPRVPPTPQPRQPRAGRGRHPHAPAEAGPKGGGFTRASAQGPRPSSHKHANRAGGPGWGSSHGSRTELHEWRCRRRGPSCVLSPGPLLRPTGLLKEPIGPLKRLREAGRHLGIPGPQGPRLPELKETGAAWALFFLRLVCFFSSMESESIFSFSDINISHCGERERELNATGTLHTRTLTPATSHRPRVGT